MRHFIFGIRIRNQIRDFSDIRIDAFDKKRCHVTSEVVLRCANKVPRKTFSGKHPHGGPAPPWLRRSKINFLHNQNGLVVLIFAEQLLKMGQDTSKMLEQQIFNLKLGAKQLERQSVKAEKAAKKERDSVKVVCQ
jgi:hypothetical protein